MRAKRPFDLKRYLISVLRKASYRYPERYAAKKAAEIGTDVKANGRTAKVYRCNHCKNKFFNEDTQVDHVVPIVSVAGFSTWDAYITSLFVSKEKLQVLCKPCHAIKTKAENAERRENRKRNKKR